MQKRSVALYTLGCKLNYSESSALGRQMEEAGFEIKGFHEPADGYVVNTCSVTEHADKKCKKIVRQALKISPNARTFWLPAISPSASRGRGARCADRCFDAAASRGAWRSSHRPRCRT